MIIWTIDVKCEFNLIIIFTFELLCGLVIRKIGMLEDVSTI